MKPDEIQSDIDALLVKISDKVNVTGNGEAATISLCVAIERLTTALGSTMQSNHDMNKSKQSPEVAYKANILPRYLLAFRLGVKAAELDPSIVPISTIIKH